MKLTPVTEKELKKGYKRTKLHKILLEFAESDYNAARLDDHEYKNANSGTNALNQSAKNFGMPHIRAITRNGNIFLLKIL